MVMCTLLSMVYRLIKACWRTHVTCTCFKETALLFNVHLNCFVDFILCPTDKYMLKVNNKKIRLICWMCSKLKINTAWQSSGVFTFNFKQVFIFAMFWKHKKRYICFVIKSCKAYLIQQIVIAPNWSKLWT